MGVLNGLTGIFSLFKTIYDGLPILIHTHMRCCCTGSEIPKLQTSVVCLNVRSFPLVLWVATVVANVRPERFQKAAQNRTLHRQVF